MTGVVLRVGASVLVKRGNDVCDAIKIELLLVTTRANKSPNIVQKYVFKNT